MRILTFLHSFEPGGVERIALRMVRQWRARGVDAPLFMGRADGAMAQDVGSGLHCHTPAQPRFGTAWWETLWMIGTLPRMIRATQPDVLFCAGNSYAIVAVAMKCLLGRRCPPIVAKVSNDLARRDMPWPVRWFYRRWLRIQGQMIDHFVGMEAPMKREIADAIRPRTGGISIIPDPALSIADLKRLRDCAALPQPDRSGRRFVAVGRLAPQKNLALMLRAFATGATHEADSLTLLGEGPQRRVLETLIGTLGIGDRVSMPGHVADPAGLLHRFDIFLLSSNYEGVPAVLIEALGAGLPIIATDCSCSIGALLREGSLGTIVPVGDERTFARAIADARPGTQDPIATLAQAQRFTMERAATDYLACCVALCIPGVAPENSLAADCGLRLAPSSQRTKATSMDDV